VVGRQAAAELTSITNAASATELSVLRMLSLLSPLESDVHLDSGQPPVDVVDSGLEATLLQVERAQVLPDGDPDRGRVSFQLRVLLAENLVRATFSRATVAGW
jgi:hypothetical protein